ncbi:hypothetical protein [Roseomonas sp. CAU 1739]|uniref:hypothetical protein n=1 Tax=Roseomonas sp. CAU 1739 TaxID=3140364 RepID=UPI00325B2DE8
MERDPDIAALAARLGLRRLTYRSFARPVIATPAVARPAVPAPPPEFVAAAPPASPTPEVPAAAFVTAPVPARPVPQAAPAPYFPLLAQALAQGGASVSSAPASAQPFLNLRRAIAGPADPAEH